MRNEKPTVGLEDWAVVPTQRNGQYQHLVPGTCLVGRAFGHPRIQNGVFIFSSAVLYCDQNGGVVETRNTTYRLGKRSQAYKAWVREQEEVNAA